MDGLTIKHEVHVKNWFKIKKKPKTLALRVDLFSIDLNNFSLFCKKKKLQVLFHFKIIDLYLIRISNYSIAVSITDKD